ncbi:hypothetical protein ACFL2R_01650 [Patescibacteria group bacterium]
MGKVFRILKGVVVTVFFLLIYGLWILCSKVANRIGLGYIGNHDGNIQTPVVFYENPETKRRVVFIGMIHIAESVYFSAVQQLIDLIESHGECQVLYEMVQPLSDEEKVSLSEKERIIFREMTAKIGSVKQLADLVGLQYQKDGLKYRSSWVNTDLRMYELVTAFAQRKRVVWGKSNFSLDDVSEAEAEKVIDFFLKHMVLINYLADLVGFFSPKVKDFNDLILGKRNDVAIQGIRRCIENEDVVTIWGAKHLPGIEKQLKAMGFQESERMWFTAYCVKNLGIF